MTGLVDFILHSDQRLLEIVRVHGSWVYGLLFAIVFAETGLVVTPFLPGDSLLFATGTLCATGVLRTPLALGLLVFAAFAGNAVNYSVGRLIGPRVFNATDRSGFLRRLLNRDHLQRAHAFFLDYGGRAVILGRFMPVVRTFVPFVAGAAQMPARSFAWYNALGAAGWVTLCLGGGLLVGKVPVVKQNFSLVVLGIVAVSMMPMLVEYLRHRRRGAVS
jgi:membrane-associated protein